MHRSFNVIHPGLTRDNQSNTCLLIDHMPAVSVDFPMDDVDEFKKLHYGKNTFLDELKKFSNVEQLVSFDYHYLDEFDNFLHYEVFFNRFAKRLVSHSQFNNKIEFENKTSKFFYASNKYREARLLASCWIKNNINDNFLYTQPWVLDEDYRDDFLDYILEIEDIELKREVLPVNWVAIKDDGPRDGTGATSVGVKGTINNFYKGLNQPYLNSVFGLALEPVFWEHGCMLTEKFLYPVLCGCIPIVNGYKVYDCIKEMGFDTFDDIINTQAQYNKNPVWRVLGLLDDNKEQLEHASQIIKDPSVQKRLLNNIEVLQNYDYNLAKSRHTQNELEFLKQFNEA